MLREIRILLLRPQQDDPHRALKDKGIIDSRCSRHMTGNKAYLADYQEFQGGSITFRETTTSMPEPIENIPKVVCEPKVWTDAPIIEKYESDSDNDSVSNVQEDKEKPSFANFVKHVKTSRENVKETGTPNHSPKIEKHDRNEYYDNSTNYGLFVNDDDDDQEIFHDAIESTSENFNENHIISKKDCDKSKVNHNDSEEKDYLVDKLIQKFNIKIAKCQKRIEKANQQSKDLENQNKDLQDKYDVLIN
nr:hypothetical protein [Tanacetum cinerariifolium]